MWRVEEVWACPLKYDNITTDSRYSYCRDYSVHNRVQEKNLEKSAEQVEKLRGGGESVFLMSSSWTEGKACTSSPQIFSNRKLCGFVRLFVWVILRVSMNQNQTTCPQLKKPYCIWNHWIVWILTYHIFITISPTVGSTQMIYSMYQQPQ